MMSPQLRHILELIERTGDRVVIYDAGADEAFVVMSLHGYEKLVDSQGKTALTAQPKDGNLQPVTEPWGPASVEESEAESEPKQEEERFYIEPVE